MLMSKLSRVGFSLIKEISTGNSKSIIGAGYSQRPFRQFLQTLQSEIKVSSGVIFQSYCHFSSASLGSDEEEQKIIVKFVKKGMEPTILYIKKKKEHTIKSTIGMSMLKAAGINNIERQGARKGSFVRSTCRVIGMDEEYYNKQEEPADDKKLMLDSVFWLKKASR